MQQEKYSSSLDLILQSSETKPLLQGKKPLLGLEFNKPNKQNVYENNWVKKIHLFSVSTEMIGDTD